MKKTAKLTLALVGAFGLSACPPGPAYTIKREVAAVSVPASCTRAAVSSVSGVAGVIINSHQSPSQSYQVLFETQNGINSLGVSQVPRYGTTTIEGAGWKNSSDTDAVVEARRSETEAVLTAIQERCGNGQRAN